MHRFLLAVLSFLVAIGLTACSSLGTLGALLGDQIVVTPLQMQGQLDRRFPRDYDKLGGLVTVTLANPRVGIAMGAQRMQLDFDYGIGALGRQGAPTGRFSVSTGLRYNPQTRGLHFDQPQLQSLVAPNGSKLGEGAARKVIDRLLADYAERDPVYQFDNSLIERIGARRIDATTIENGTVVVRLGQ